MHGIKSFFPYPGDRHTHSLAHGDQPVEEIKRCDLAAKTHIDKDRSAVADLIEIQQGPGNGCRFFGNFLPGEAIPGGQNVFSQLCGINHAILHAIRVRGCWSL
ncbi:MAG: hypothetical protein ACD_75C00808G0002 [uncultured bacterium]|nr:MAG: hypothetical protein ACD_75C00808G0002 [uncultured bacterium]